MNVYYLFSISPFRPFSVGYKDGSGSLCQNSLVSISMMDKAPVLPRIHIPDIGFVDRGFTSDIQRWCVTDEYFFVKSSLLGYSKEFLPVLSMATAVSQRVLSQR
jgi:hypothetical protein